MTLPLQGSGAISMSQVNTELGLAANTLISLNQANVRTLFGVGGSGTVISMSQGYGKSNRSQISYTYGPATGHVANASLNVSAIGGYVAGKSDIVVYVTAGYYLYATTTGNYGLTLSGGTTGDTITLVNQGYIIGCGGQGASRSGSTLIAGGNGGPALSIATGVGVTINNTYGSAYIAGGGGGGGAGMKTNTDRASTGGGGAGGGSGGYSSTAPTAAGGGIGATGSSGTITHGGGGGRVLPGAGGAGGYLVGQGSAAGAGGGAGGGGGVACYTTAGTAKAGGAGGAGAAAGGYGYGTSGTTCGGGGGGWGAVGGIGVIVSNSLAKLAAAGNGGSAITLNGRSVTWVSGDTSRIYGSVA